MNVFTHRSKSTAVVAAAAAIFSLSAGATASAGTPSRTATVFTDGTYLQDALGLPSTDTNPVIETVTYDRFQWLLKQSGNFAFLIGDPSDANFQARAQDVEAAAKAAGVKKVYWFDPNLSGKATVGSTTEPGLDTRNPASITQISANSQKIYGYTWTNLVAQYLGNGYKATIVASPVGAGASEGGTITTAQDDTVVNDTDNPIFDYRSTGNAEVAGESPNDDYFFIYNKDHVDGSNNPDKIVNSVDLTSEASSTSTQTDVTAAITAIGATNIIRLDQSAFWHDEVNAKYHGSQAEPALNPTANNDAPNSDDVISSADAADWRIQQITYPQLVHLLNSATSQNAIILFGGTWCPNTRAVLTSVNQYAIDNNVPVVYNFDTVLDGGWIGGGTTSSSDPLQVRNAAAYTSTPNANPSFLYGDLESNYLANIATQYDPTRGNGAVTYFPGGDTTKPLASVKKLQVPFLIGYQKGASAATSKGGVTRQWIQQNTDVSGLPYFTEYMSEPYYTHPQPYGLALKIPHDAAIWSTINSDLSSFTWQSDPAASALTSHYNTATDADDAAYLSASEVATVTYNSTANGGAGSVTAAVANPGTATTAINPGVSSSSVLAVSPAALAAAKSALGANTPATKSAAQSALLAAEKAASPDATLIGNLATVYGAYSVAQARKTSILSTWSSVQFGLEAVSKLNTFFGGLPGGVVSTRTITAKTVSYGAAPTINVAIANDYGRVPTGNISLTVTRGATTVATASKAVAQNAASFILPKLAPGSYSYALSYSGDDQLAAFSDSGTLTVAKAKVSKLTGSVAATPTTKTAGKYRVTISTPAGLAHATGSVTIRVKKGSTTKVLTGKLVNGVATIAVPKLAKGTWTVAVSYAGDSDYLAASGSGASLKITK